MTVPPQEVIARVKAQRVALNAAGFRPVEVYNVAAGRRLGHPSPGKQPFGDKWQLKAQLNPPHAVTALVNLDATNTGIWAGGLRIFDFDMEDAAAAQKAREITQQALGPAPMRYRSNAPRFALVYRAATGEPRKAQISGSDGKVEVLGHGQHLVAFGDHESGVDLEWNCDLTSVTLTEVTEDQVRAVLAELAPLLGKPVRSPQSATGPRNGATDFSIADALTAIEQGAGSHDALLYAAGSLIRRGVSEDDTVAFLQSAMRSRPAVERDPAWQAAYDDVPRLVRFVFEKEEAKRPPPPPVQEDYTPPGTDDAYADATTGAPSDGPDLSVLRLNRRPAPAFPLDVLGPEWGAWVEQAADAACCPVDYVAAPLLASASALIGNARWPMAWEGWIEPPHVWICAAGDSGSGKSPGADTLLRAVVPELERRMCAEFPDAYREWKLASETYTAALDQWRAGLRPKLTKKDEKPGAPSPHPGDAPVEPQEPRLKQHDVTHEKVAALLAGAAPKGLLMVRDELAGFLIGMNAYNDAARSFWLEAYGGRPYKVERQKLAAPLVVPHNVVAWYGTTQPERLAEVMGDVDDGLLARFMMVWPEPIEFRRPKQTPGVDLAVQRLDRLRVLEMSVDPRGAPTPMAVRLSNGAQDVLEAFGRETQQKEVFVAGLLKSAYGKARGLVLRLSLILEYLRWTVRDAYDAPPAQIAQTSVEGAATLVRDYVLPMAERAYGDAALPQEERNVTTLARWLVRHRPAAVQVRALQRGQLPGTPLPGLREAEPIHAACWQLVEANWLFPPSGGSGPRGGRPKSVYRINPTLWSVLS
jgi:hypothetical protein